MSHTPCKYVLSAAAEFLRKRGVQKEDVTIYKSGWLKEYRIRGQGSFLETLRLQWLDRVVFGAKVKTKDKVSMSFGRRMDPGDITA